MRNRVVWLTVLLLAMACGRDPCDHTACGGRCCRHLQANGDCPDSQEGICNADGECRSIVFPNPLPLCK